jgi:hypothetical protein
MWHVGTFLFIYVYPCSLLRNNEVLLTTLSFRNSQVFKDNFDLGAKMDSIYLRLALFLLPLQHLPFSIVLF